MEGDDRECYENTEGRINKVHKMLDKFSYTQIEHVAVFEKVRKMLYKIEQSILDTYEAIQLPLAATDILLY